MAREGGDVLDRHDSYGNTYYEIRAENFLGNRGGSVPMYANGQFARKVAIRTGLGPLGAGPSYSWWFIRSDSSPVFGDGTGYPDSGMPEPGSSFVSLNHHKWSLLARWVSFNTVTGDIKTLDDERDVRDVSGDEWFEVGKETVISVPIPELIIPTPLGTGGYNPLVQLQYICNDDDRNDNGGWLHVYETWSP